MDAGFFTGCVAVLVFLATTAGLLVFLPLPLDANLRGGLSASSSPSESSEQALSSLLRLRLVCRHAEDKISIELVVLEEGSVF